MDRRTLQYSVPLTKDYSRGIQLGKFVYPSGLAIHPPLRAYQPQRTRLPLASSVKKGPLAAISHTSHARVCTKLYVASEPVT